MNDINITLHLVADTPDQLSVLTVRTQILWGMEFSFFDFSQRKDGKFICWYKVPHKIWIEKVANGKA